MDRLSRMALAGLGLAVALAACSKSSTSTSTSTTTTESSAAAAPADTSGGTNGVAASDGAKVYQQNCSSCHQQNGQGVADTFPPLAGNPVVQGDPAKVIHIVRYGLTGKIVVAGKTYNGMMPNWSPQLSNDDIATVITYVRSAWGNTAGAVTSSQVGSVKK